ncbi:hypothetical protein AWC02_10390 [Mycolicibacter engbaekii]|uniref:Uncharacterized protein n=1 Tax=Mycolicibacter engbaekii TaxID=188915 RepID=A0A1X1TRK9_9MYCO|nr:hypothetical protein AWC02_10390 [Mycolicibacter engbaekii]
MNFAMSCRMVVASVPDSCSTSVSNMVDRLMNPTASFIAPSGSWLAYVATRLAANRESQWPTDHVVMARRVHSAFSFMAPWSH